MKLIEMLKEVITVKSNMKKIAKISKETMSILKKGKFKTKKAKIKFKKFNEASVRGAICEFLGERDEPATSIAISTVTDSVVIQDNITASPDFFLSKDNSSIVLVRNKKKALEYEMSELTSFSDLLRSSNLYVILSELKGKIKEGTKAVDKEEPFVVYIPNVVIFRDPYEGDIYHTPKLVNVTILYENSYKDMKEALPMENKNEFATIATNVVADIMDAAIRLEITTFAVAPLEAPYFDKDKDQAAKIWAFAKTNLEKVSKFIDRIFFMSPNYSEFITLHAAMVAEMDKATKVEDDEDVKEEVKKKLKKENPTAIKEKDDEDDED